MSKSGLYGEAELGEWFKRPILIKTYQWAETLPLLDSFDPFVEYFGKEVVKKKLNGYSRMRCDLKLKFVVNATPFQYGMAYAAYKPLSYSKPFINDVTQPEYDDFSGGVVGFLGRTDLFIPYSTRNHIEILPQVNQGGELSIPFCYPGNWFPLHKTIFKEPFVSTGWGKVDLVSLINLRSSSPNTSADCNINVYAWCDNIELTAPANIEFQAGRISDMMSTFGEMAEGLGSTLKFLKPYTSIVSGVAGGAATVAKLFGHTPTYQTEPAHRVAVVTAPSLAEADDGCEVHNLQLTSKNVIPMDPTDTGCPMVDELEMSYVLSKPVFVTYSDWTSTAVTGTNLMQINVSPEIFTKVLKTGVGATDYYTVNQSMSSFLSTLHKYWRGPITYRVKVICSQYHRGRLKITFDPVEGGVPTEGYQISRIMDLNETSSCDIEVPWFAPTYWLECQHLVFDPSTNFYNVNSTLSNVPVPVGLAPIDATKMLGRVYIDVLNELRSPDEVADAAIVVYADTSKLEFAYPIGDAAAEQAMLSNCMEPIDLQAGESEHYFGECNKSLRTLCQRTTDYFDYILSEKNYEQWSMIVPRIPGGRGVVETNFPTPYSGSYYNGTFKNVTNSLVKNGLVNSLTYPSLIYPCYVGQRGSYVWRLHKGSSGGNINNIVATIFRWYKNLGTTTCTIGNLPRDQNESFNPGLPGMVKAGGVNEPYIAARVQTFLPFKFASCNPIASYNQRLVDAQDNLVFTLRGPHRATDLGLKHTMLNLMVAAGDDWTCFGYLNVPTMYLSKPQSGIIQTNITTTTL